MPDKTDDTTTPDPVDQHPLASQLRRAFKAHPILKLQKKLIVALELGRPKVQGSVYTQHMLRQVHEIVARLGASDITVAVEAEVKPVQGRDLIGRVPDVSGGAGSTTRTFSISHLPPR